MQTEGLDQLKNPIGKPQVGDTVSIHIRGYYIKSNNKRKEFEDTWHSEKLHNFKIGADQTIPGIETCVVDMELGEEATITMTPDVGYGDKPHNGYCAVVPPNSNLVLEVALMTIVRNGKEHRRKRPKDTSGLTLKCLYNCFRGY